MWEVKVAGRGSGGGSRQQLTVHPHRQDGVRAEVGQKLLRCGEAFIAGTPGGDPVTGVRQGVVGEHEAICVEGMREGGHAGRQRALVEGMERVGGIHQREAGLQGGGRVVYAGVAVAAAQVGHAGIAETVGVSTQALHEGRRGGPGKRAGAWVLSGNSHTSNTEGGFRRVQSRDKLRRVARVSPH